MSKQDVKARTEKARPEEKIKSFFSKIKNAIKDWKKRHIVKQPKNNNKVCSGFSHADTDILKTHVNLAHLRGLASAKSANETQPNPYDKLDSEQLDVAMGYAHENLVRMQQYGSRLTASGKYKLLKEIDLIINSAQKRFPNTKVTSKGTYFADPELQNTGAKLFTYMKENNKENPDNIDIRRLEAWRQNQEFIEQKGDMTFSESPFHNTAKYNGSEESKYGIEIDERYFANPLKQARLSMTKAERTAMLIQAEKLVLAAKIKRKKEL